MSTLPSKTLFTPNPLVSTTKRGGLVPLALVDKVTVPVVTGKVTESSRLAIAFYMMAAGTSKSSSIKEWKAYIVAYILCIAPSLQARMPGNLLTFVSMTDAQVKGITDAIDSFKASFGGDDPAVPMAAARTFTSGPLIPGLPTPDAGADWSDADGEWVTKVILAHFSIVLFLAGKRIDGDDHTAISVARPEALRSKAHIADVSAFLDGPLRLSDSSHLHINNAWAEMAGVRAVTFTEFAKYSQSDTDFSQDIIYTTMHLLRYNGMQHARITMDFLHAYPWVTEVPALRTSIAVYLNSIKATADIDPALQPYLKLIYGDKVSIFPRKELDPLIACAVAAAKEVSTTLVDFYVNSDYNAVVEAFLEERDRRMKIREAELRIRELRMEEMEAELGESAVTPDTSAGV